FRDYQSAANGLKTQLGLLQGVLRFFVKRSIVGAQFEVDTETAVAAVRGTDWLMEATPDRTSVAVLQGVVAVSGRGAPAGAPALLEQPGQGIDVVRGEALKPVHPWSAERLATTLARATFD
ncbi:MAG TPA: FecR domain-containing protein, partial [Stellaceae bacterium]|nr:FecR domain-containing protein [Stellaceae bacterium]